MDYFTVDFETFWGDGYTLRTMTPVEYICDARFEVIMMSVKRPGKSPFVLPPEKIQAFFDMLDPNETALISHNALFDASIVAWVYGFIPKLTIDTLGMSRAWLQHLLRSLSLDSVSNYLQLGVKGKEVHNAKNLRRADLVARGQLPAYERYCADDAVLCEGIFLALIKDGFPANELIMADLVIRMTINPQFVMDAGELAQHHNDIVQTKNELITLAGIMSDEAGKTSLSSNAQFATLLESLGVDPPRKISPLTGRETFAFSKSDQDFTDLQDHPDLLVQAIVAARIGVKSTIEESRCERLLNISRLAWPPAWQKRCALTTPYAGLMPMPLRYSGAHTHRLSGDWKLNVQNFPSRGKVNHLKNALKAPAGHTVLNTDSSQIEARIVAWLAGEQDLLDQFEQGLDPYKIFAAKVFKIDVASVSPEQRFLGKTSILGLGFGLGWIKFKAQVRVKSLEAIRYTGKGQELILSEFDANTIVQTYRGTFPGVPKLWKRLNDIGIPVLAGLGGSLTIGPCVFSKGEVSLPSGLKLRYHNLRNTTDGWVYDFAGRTKRLYGGALLENIVQALARCIVMDAALKIRKQLPDIQLVLQVHDALAYIVPDALVDQTAAILDREMRVRPAWAPTLPLAAELKKGPSYGECH